MLVFVARFFHPDHSATSQLASDLAMHLARQGLDVRVITSRQRYDDAQADLPGRNETGGVIIHRVWTTRFGRAGLPGRMIDYLSFYVSASWRLLFVATRATTVIAMTDPPLVSVPALLVTRLRGARLVNWLQDVFPEVAANLGALREPWLIGALRSLRNLSLRLADENVTIGGRMALFIEAQCGRAPQVIANWALEEMDDLPASGLGQTLRAGWQLDGAFVVGYSGNMGRAHRLDVLVDAAALLRDDPRIVFLLIGDGAQRAALETRVRSLGLANVIFKPYQPRDMLRQSLTLPDLHVVSLDERLEGLIVPSKFVGVIALGRPVLFLGNPAGEIGGLVTGSGCGVVAAPDDPHAIAAAIRRLAAEPAVALGMRVAAQQLWKRSFRRSAALASWQTLLGRT